MPSPNRHEISINTVDDNSTAGSYDARRLRANDTGLGVTEAIHRHITRHVVTAKPVSQRRLEFEQSRPRWLREMAAEATGVFVYVYAFPTGVSGRYTTLPRRLKTEADNFYIRYPGIASVATFTLNGSKPEFSSLFQIGLAFALGISLAVIICGPVSIRQPRSIET